MEDYEISVQELSKRDADSYILIDIRDDSSYSYGNIPGSLHVPKDILEADYEKYKDEVESLNITVEQKVWLKL